ncbi:hypothetical protein GCM10022402_05060 [Salinactinospora qingdaonensis]|uniref:Uncharacterized protein n=1 Tax=Salinactinospora qingdaonensis TaxID=702744 RepID=A0ABP7EZN4_9ACTN
MACGTRSRTGVEAPRRAGETDSDARHAGTGDRTATQQRGRWHRWTGALAVTIAGVPPAPLCKERAGRA